MPKVDLQIQTTFSDGRDTPLTIIQLAKAAKIDFIAITDHDTVKGISEFQTLATREGITCIPGIELSVGDRKLLHLLAYNIDPNDAALLRVLDEQNETRRREFTAYIPELNKKLHDQGFSSLDGDLYKQKDETYFSIPGIVRFMKESGVIDDSEKGFPLVRGMAKWSFPLDMKAAIKVVHAAGGVASFSHALAPKVSLKRISDDKNEWKKIISEFRAAGLDALELSSTGHSSEENDLLAEWAKELGIFVTYGGDWHGSFEKVGESIKEYLPYYTGELSGIEISDEEYAELRKHL